MIRNAKTKMTKLLTTVLAMAGLALATAGSAYADEAGFIRSIDSLDYYATECPGCSEDAVGVGYRACAALSRSKQAAVQAVMTAYNGPGQTSREYYATLFTQYAAHQLCPEHDGKIGPI